MVTRVELGTTANFVVGEREIGGRVGGVDPQPRPHDVFDVTDGFIGPLTMRQM